MGMVRVGVGWVVEGWKGRLRGGGCGRERGLRRFGGAKGCFMRRWSVFRL